MFEAPTRCIYYRNGITLTTRQDEPTHQCTSCYKPWYEEDLDLFIVVATPKCPYCGSNVRRLTKQRPLK
ncbi:hypothetical protein VME0621_05264 [Vibrio mediterranei]|uniref:Uncharacterized protein n=1 Tax=Vibrio mediterranei TaxID=689 RepID=A0A3G4V566_9VIBR|nr:hypothetical protein ECB94_00335 [Vibrio mediterranei]AYV19838.1 hypothetical protein ECB94_00375 [Vibrio mediterranei]SBO13083.1 hypothetical protein VME0621_05264 [Vibrio mediterranei]